MGDWKRFKFLDQFDKFIEVVDTLVPTGLESLNYFYHF